LWNPLGYLVGRGRHYIAVGGGTQGGSASPIAPGILPGMARQPFRTGLYCLTDKQDFYLINSEINPVKFIA
jgi:hypothetical protein